MRRIFGIPAVAGLMALGAGGAATAQGLNLRIGIGDHGLRRHSARSRIGERRAARPGRTRLVCRTVIRERVRASGVVVRRPVEECRRVHVD
ncbi:MAG TPA: hypothetical protein VK434_06090 [Microvirga sp.]|nr:hypothetical protein [Microvirga sp.]